MLSKHSVIQVSRLSKCYHIYEKPRDRLLQIFVGKNKRLFREFWALRDISFDVHAGETVGIIGKNGSGKSTLLQIIAGTLSPSQGHVTARGRITALLELGSGFNPEFSGRENVFLNGIIAGLSRREIENKFESIVDFSEIGDFIDQPIKTYSSGMVMRLAFATQAALEPEILIVDEALAVGDMNFQIKCFSHMNRLKANGTTILFVSHSLGSVLSFCDRALYLKDGRQVAFGQVQEVAKKYEQDSLQDKMTPRENIPYTATYLNPNSISINADGLSEFSLLEKSIINAKAHFQDSLIGQSRQGSGRVTIESFALIRKDGSMIEAIDPLEAVFGCFIIKFNAELTGGLHLSINILDKYGTPLMVIRDSYFDHIVGAKAGTIFFASMHFSLPLQAGVYYCRTGVLLFPDGAKYQSGRFNFEEAEIGDLIEQSGSFTVLPFSRHPIPMPVLQESRMSLLELGGRRL